MGALKKRNQAAKYHALNDMNKLNIPTYLLRAFNDRRKNGRLRMV